MGKLTDKKIKSFSSKNAGFHYDGDYLYLKVSPKGKKVFFFKSYRFNGRTISDIKLGEYYNGKTGLLTLASARDKARDIIRCYQDGIDYKEKIRQAKERERTDNSLNHWFNQWIATKQDLTPKTLQGHSGRYNNHIKPILGKRKITDISINDVESLYQSLQENNAYETVNRCRMVLSWIFDHAIKRRVITFDPADIAKDIIIKDNTDRHLPAIHEDTHTDLQIGKLYLDTYTYNGSIITNYAFKILPYLFLRPSELLTLNWCDIDFTADLIIIPAERMKKKREHAIPYPQQVKALLWELQQYTGHYRNVFTDNGSTPMKSETISKAMRRMGYKNIHCPHGFRSTASKWLHNRRVKDKLFNYEPIELQLAHAKDNKVETAYNRFHTLQFINERRELMQAYANHIDNLRAKAQSHLMQGGIIEIVPTDT